MSQMLFTHNQQVALALLPKCSGLLSMCASAWIVVEVLKEPSKRSNVYHRLLCGMSIWDGIVSFAMLLSTWPMPAGGEDEDNTVWTVGDDLTCTLQGAFIQFSVGPPIYNFCLAIYYMLVVKYKNSEKEMKKIEPFMHALPNLVGFGTALFGLYSGIYGSAMLWCWIEPDYTDYRWAMYYIPLWVVIILITTIMIAVYRTVERREMKMMLEEPTDNRVSVTSMGSEASYAQRYNFSFRSSLNSGTDSDSNVRAPAVGGTSSNANDGLFLLPEPMVDALRRSRASRIGIPIPASLTNVGTSNGKPGDRNDDYILMSDALQRANLNRDPSGQPPSKQARNPSILSGGVLDADQILEAIGGFSSVKEQRSVESNKLGCRAVFRQSLYYTLSFYAAFAFPTLNRILELNGYEFFWAFLLHAACIPLQGFFNLLVYRYPFYRRLKQRHPGMSRWQRIRQSARWSFLGPITKSNKVTASQWQTQKRNIDAGNSNNLQSNLLKDRTNQPPDLLSSEFHPSIGGSVMMQSIIDDMLDFDQDYIGDDFHDLMEFDLNAVYSEFPTALTEDTVVVPTDFPVVLRRMSIPEEI